MRFRFLFTWSGFADERVARAIFRASLFPDSYLLFWQLDVSALFILRFTLRSPSRPVSRPLILLAALNAARLAPPPRFAAHPSRQRPRCLYPPNKKTRL